MARQKANTATIRSQERQVKALELRRTGATYGQIASKLTISLSTAHKLVQTALIATIREPAEAVRALELERLDSLTRTLERRIKEDDHDDKAISAILKVMTHRAAITGILAPVTIQGPDGTALRFVVEVPTQAPTLAEWQALASAVIDVHPQPTLEDAHDE